MQPATLYSVTATEAEPLAFYATPGSLTDPGPHAALFDDLPTTLPALVEVVQGVLLPVAWAGQESLSLPKERRAEVSLRTVTDMLSRLQELSPGPLTAPRTPEERLAAHSRHFATLLAALLRAQGRPARVRCGFAAYITPAAHWLCETWDAASTRWVMIGAALDAHQRQALRIDFDPLDVPAGRFMPAGRAWKLTSQNPANADLFGTLDAIQASLLRDLAALNKVELLPWDRWGLGTRPAAALTPSELNLLDRVAELTLACDKAFASLRRTYTADDRLTVPADLFTVPPVAFHPIAA